MFKAPDLTHLTRHSHKVRIMASDLHYEETTVYLVRKWNSGDQKLIQVETLDRKIECILYWAGNTGDGYGPQWKIVKVIKDNGKKL